MSASRVRLHSATDPDSSRVRRLLEMLRNIEDPILTCLIGTNLFNVTFTAVVTAALTTRYGEHGEWLSLALCSVIIIILGEILPKVLFREFQSLRANASASAIAISRLRGLTQSPIA